MLALERRFPEPPKRAGARTGRGEFARDRARVLHSYAFRRLADKTQVVVPGSDDFPRTRLTHSLEVAQIGRELALALGCDPDVVDTAGLAHDLGHPPFGHNGEDALNACALDIGGFEGNAQTFRILTRLEAKIVGPAGEPGGLNLTRAVLAATGKYPWPRRPGNRKFGVYASDADAFAWVGVGTRCLEAQLMDWADDVAYSVHDVEDGVYGGHIVVGSVDRAALCEVAAELYSPLHPAALAPVLDDLLGLPTLRDLAGFDRSYAAQAAAKRATSELTGRFAGAATVVDGVLVLPERVIAECALLKAMAAHYVMRRPGVAELQSAQRRLLTELVAALLDATPGALEPALAPGWQDTDESGRLRVVIDQVAQLTDTSATTWHGRLVGPRS